MKRHCLRLSLWPTLALLFVASPVPLARADGKPVEDPALPTYYNANGLLNRGLYELAVDEYRKFLAENPDHEKAPVARYGLGVSLFRRKQFQPAVEALTPLLTQRGFSYAAETLTIMGQSHLALQQYKKAASMFDRVLAKHAEHELADDAEAGAAEAIYLLCGYEDAINRCRRFVTKWPQSDLRVRVEFFWGLAAMQRTKYGEAAERFASVLKQAPAGPFVEQASLLLAQCLHQNNKPGEAARYYQKVLASSNHPGRADALLGLALVLQEKGQNAKAGQLLDELLQKFPKHTLSNRAKMARGRVFFALSQFDKALALFGPLMEAPGDTQDDALYWTAKCNLRQGKQTRAIELLDIGLARSEKSNHRAGMEYDRAVALSQTGQFAMAAEALALFRKRFPTHPMAADALYLLANTLHRLERYQDSMTLTQLFLKNHGTHELAWAAKFLLAENLFLKGNYAAALPVYLALSASTSKHLADRAGEIELRTGMSLYRLQRYDEAEPILGKVVRRNNQEPSYRLAQLALGDIYFQRGAWKRAQSQLKAYLSNGDEVPAADDAWLKLGLAHLRLEDSEHALEAFDHLLRQFSDSDHRLQALFERGQALVATGQSEQATKTFEEVLAKGGDSRFLPFTLKHLAALANERKDFETAAKYFSQLETGTPLSGADKAMAAFHQAQAFVAAQDFAKAEHILQRIADSTFLADRHAEVLATLAVCLSRQDKFEDSLRVITRVENMDRPIKDAQRSTLQYEKAWCLRKLNRHEESAQAYVDLLKGQPSNELRAHALLDVSLILADEKKCKKAAPYLEQLLDMALQRPAAVSLELREQATYRLGVCEFRMGRMTEAVGRLTEFVAAYPDSALLGSASFFCGEALFGLGRHREAVDHLQRVVALSPSDDAFGPASLRLGECEAALQRWAKSEQTLTNYLKRFGNDDHWFQAQFGVAWAKENQHHLDEAISAYRKVVDQHKGPTAARAQFQIGECLFAKKQYGKAARELLKVDILYAYPEWSAAALYEAGRCFEKLGKGVEARTQFQAVAKQYDNTKWAKLATERLTKLHGATVPGR